MPHKRAKRSVRDQQRSQSGHDNAPVKSLLSNEGIPKGISRVLNAASIREDWRKKRKAEAEEGPAVKRRRKEGGGKGGQERDDKKDANMKILPGESLAHFNRRVEDGMRPLVRAAMSTASSKERQARQDEIDAKKAAKGAKKDQAAALTKTGGRKQGSADDDDVSSGEDHARADRPHQQKPLTTTKSTTTPKTSSSNPTSKPTKERASEFATANSSAPRRLNDIAQAPPMLSKVPKARKASAAFASVGGTAGAAKAKADGVVSMAQRAMMDAERERVIQRYRELKERRAAAAGKTAFVDAS